MGWNSVVEKTEEGFEGMAGGGGGTATRGSQGGYKASERFGLRCTLRGLVV